MPTITEAVMLLLDDCASRIAEKVRTKEGIILDDDIDLALIIALNTSYPDIYAKWTKRAGI